MRGSCTENFDSSYYSTPCAHRNGVVYAAVSTAAGVPVGTLGRLARDRRTFQVAWLCASALGGEVAAAPAPLSARASTFDSGVHKIELTNVRAAAASLSLLCMLSIRPSLAR